MQAFTGSKQKPKDETIKEFTVGNRVTIDGKEHKVMGFTRRDGKTYVRIKAL